MKILVTYYSETGNTEKLARAIYEGIDQAEKDILPIQEVGSIDDYDLIFCGFPVISSTVPKKAVPFLKSIPEGKKVAIFATHGCFPGGRLATTAFEYATSLVSKAKVLGTFGCRGEVKSSLIEELVKLDEHRGWAEEARSAFGHPDQADLEDGKMFVQKMLTKARTL